MPYSEHPPDLVLPYCEWGFAEFPHYAGAQMRVEFCREWKLDESPIFNEWSPHMKMVCRNREPMGDRRHNHCFRCVVGFPLWNDQKQSDYSEHRSLRV
jgi:hypothetical protein